MATEHADCWQSLAGMDFLISTPAGGWDGAACFLMAHGAGVAMDTPFMETIAHQLAAQGILVVRFEFPYMAQRRSGGSKRPPDRQPVLLECWKAAYDAIQQAYQPRICAIGGKSMGGRMASLVAGDLAAAGLVGLGFPFHAPGKPEKAVQRIAHFDALTVPTLICQGSRDTMGSRETVDMLKSSRPEAFLHVQFEWLDDGDHSLKPRKKSGRTESENLAQASDEIVDFIYSLTA